MDNLMSFSEDFLNSIKLGMSNDKVIEVMQKFSCLNNPIDASGMTLLHYSVQYNNEIVVQYLLNNGCDINVQDSMGNTPLMIAVSENHENLIQTLLEAGADILKSNKEHKSALFILGRQHVIKYDMVQLFYRTLQKNSSIDEEIADMLTKSGCPIYLAILMGNPTIIKYMILRGCSVEYAHPTNNTTGMHVAALIDSLSIVQLLSYYSTDANALNAMDENPLSFVYKNKRDHNCRKIQILKSLLRQGAAMTSSTDSGFFQAKCTLTEGSCQAIHVLLRSGLDFNAKDDHAHRSVLHYLAKNTNPGVAEKLKLYEEELDVNVVDGQNQTPLCVSVQEGNVRMVKFFLKQRARTDVEYSTNNPTPLYYAYKCTKPGFEKRYRECGEMLLQNNADPQLTFTNQNGVMLTIFDAALEINDYDRVKPVVAHLAMLKKSGTPINELILTKIYSHESLKQYFNDCREILSEEISEESSEEFSLQVDLLDLLASDKKKMARYLNCENIVRELWKRSNYKRRLAHFSYYYNVLQRRCLQGKRYKTLKNCAAKVICEIFKNRIHETHIVIDVIIDKLDDQSLQQISVVAKKILEK